MDFRRDKFVGYVEERRRFPRGDILSELANATYPDGSTPDVMDVVRVATLLFGAGQDTTAALLGNAMRIIAERPDLQTRLRADTALVPDFLEEVLRALAGQSNRHSDLRASPRRSPVPISPSALL